MVYGVMNRIKQKWMRMRLKPIRVFCIHHISDVYDPLAMWEEDWTHTDVLKNFINDLRTNGYTFISLPEAHEKLRHDWYRCKRYAVFTADDGFRSLLSILPWLEEERIPITLFINPKYILEDSMGGNTKNRLEQMHSNKSSEEIYLKLKDIQTIKSPSLSFGYHGFEHLDEWSMDKDTFTQNVEQCMVSMRKNFPNVISFYAHTYGHARKENDEVLSGKGLTPVYISGNTNYNNVWYIDRELISNERLLKGEVHV